MLEIEVKIRIEDQGDIAEKIKSLGAEIDKPRHFEENILYDFGSNQLSQKGHALRLRNINKKSFLTFKGTKQKSRKFKIREEYETEVKNGKQARKILKSLGLQPVFQYHKYRTVFRKKKLIICLDETSAGTYLELEGQQTEIVKFAHALHIPKKNFITKDYVQLMMEDEEKKRSEVDGKRIR